MKRKRIKKRSFLKKRIGTSKEEFKKKWKRWRGRISIRKTPKEDEEEFIRDCENEEDKCKKRRRRI